MSRAERLAALKKQEEEATRRARLRGRDREDEDEDDRKDAAKQAEIADLRGEVSKLRVTLASVERDLSEARIRAGYGRDRSPPGSLQTWGQRAAELARARSKVEAQLVVRESRLKELDPRYRPQRR